MKLTKLIFLYLALPIAAVAQTDTTYWNVGGNLGANFNQSTLTNWAAGGANSVAGAAYANFIFDYAKDRAVWQNTVELGYGFIQESGEEQRKADDKIVLNSSYGYKLSPTSDTWKLNALLDFRTQFAEGFNDDDYDNYISKFMAPAYLLASLGIDYNPVEYFSVKFGPLSSKMTIVMDDSLSSIGAFGVDPGDEIRLELGGLLTARFQKEIFTNGTLTSNLQLFTNYLDHPDRIDVNWENNLVMRINNFLSANIYNQLIYDYDVKFEKLDADGNLIDLEERVQFKNILGLGLTVTFGGVRQ